MNGRVVALAGLAACAAAPLAAGLSTAAFSATSANASNSVASAPDWAAPAVASAVVVRQGAARAGTIAPGASYFVYASVSDPGNPPSGTTSVSADMSALTSTAGPVALSSGSWTVDAVAYNYRAGPLTADASLAPGPAAFTLTVTDGAGNSATRAGFSAVVDTTPPAAVDVQSANGGATVSRLEARDALTLTFSETVDPASISAGWDGAAPLSAVVRLNRGTAGGDDNLTFYDASNAAQLPLGTVDLGRNDYTNANVTFGAGGTASTISAQTVTVAGRPATELTITLGVATGTVKTAKAAGTMTWQPAAALLDPAGNAMATAPATESGTADGDF